MSIQGALTSPINTLTRKSNNFVSGPLHLCTWCTNNSLPSFSAFLNMIFVVYNYSLLQDEIIGILSDSDRKHKPAVFCYRRWFVWIISKKETLLRKESFFECRKKEVLWNFLGFLNLSVIEWMQVINCNTHQYTYPL